MNEITPEEAAKKFGMKKSPAGRPVEGIAPIEKPIGPPPPADMMGRVIVEEFKRLKLGQLVVRVDNPRAKINEEKPSFRELVESVRELGVVTPLIVRPHPTMPDIYEILAGHRRERAADVVELPDVPAMVKHLNDREALEVMCLENFDREDLTPLEEARSYRLMLDSDHSIEQLAVRIGKSRGHIARRANLLNLSKEWQEWAEERGVGAAHLELIARYPKERQAGLLERLDSGYDFDRLFMGPGSVRALAAEIADEMRDLMLAPWSLDDAVLDAKAGACALCPKRSGCQPDLFGDETEGGDRCLDPDCWNGKMKVFKERKEAALRVEHPGLVKVIAKDGSDYSSDNKGALKSWEYEKAGKKSAGAVPALVVDGTGEGTMIWVKPKARSGSAPQATQKLQTAAAKQAQASQDPKECAKLLAEKREGLEQRRLAWVIQKLLGLLLESGMPAAEEFTTDAGLLALVSGFGTDDAARRDVDMPEPWSTKPGGIAQREAVWEFVKPKIRQEMFYHNAGRIYEHHAEGCVWLAHLLGVKLDVLKEEAEKEIPEPKSWQGLVKLAEAPAAKKGEQSRSEAKTAEGNKAKGAKSKKPAEASCRVCGCTEADCSQCVEATGHPCSWVEPDLCSRCAEESDAQERVPTRATGKKKGGAK